MTKDRTALQPDTIDQLSPIGFRLGLEKNPNMTFWVTDCVLPGISTDGIRVATGRHAAMVVPGDTLVFEDFSATFIVDEKMANWQEIQQWLYALTSARTTRDYKNLRKEKPDGETSDIHLTILTNKENAQIRVKFHDAFPIALTPIQFDTKATETDPIAATVTFGFTTYTLETL
jgi:hypothetical protein